MANLTRLLDDNILHLLTECNTTMDRDGRKGRFKDGTLPVTWSEYERARGKPDLFYREGNAYHKRF